MLLNLTAELPLLSLSMSLTTSWEAEMQFGAVDIEKYGNIATYNFADPQAMCKVTYLFHAVA